MQRSLLGVLRFPCFTALCDAEGRRFSCGVSVGADQVREHLRLARVERDELVLVDGERLRAGCRAEHRLVPDDSAPAHDGVRLPFSCMNCERRS